jgi:phosphomannomutase
VTASASREPPAQATRAVAERWLEAELDADIRAELAALLGGDDGVLTGRFSGRLQFGTAGLRAEVGAGPLRMNRLVVRQAAAGLADHLLDTDPTTTERGVVIGYDARRKSDTFAVDTARVLAARGIPAELLPGAGPTPLLAWSITFLDAAAGVMVTASHNPPADNGYKVYLDTGSQIVSPIDEQISARIAAIDPTAVPVAAVDDALIDRLDNGVLDAYLASVPAVRLRPEIAGVPVAYTAMHGVAGAVVVAAFAAAGFDPPVVVEDQFEPDPTFPTVSFPNPEEPGAMDLVMALAESSGSLIALANDPDGDRLGVAIPQPDGTWRRLGGDEVGWLLADHILANTAGDDRLVVTTLVSSSLLGEMAERHGVHHAETYTGFKWIGRTVLDRPDQRFVFGYEQALGYLVTSAPLDKDGITAAVLMAEIAAVSADEGVTLQERLDGIAARFGRHVVADLSVRMDPDEAAARVAALEADPPSKVGDAEVVTVRSFPEASLLRLVLDGGIRLQVRPSGTEPKVKLYGEAVDLDPAPYLTALAQALTST